jgi:putative ABC transport system permease protein
MILTYVLRNFRRRKVRTILMILALIVGVGTLVALNATVDSYRRFFAGTVAGEVGDFDLVLTRPDTAPNPFIVPEEIIPLVEAVPGVRSAAPRIHAVVSVRTGDGDRDGEAAMVALDPAVDTAGTLERAQEGGRSPFGGGTSGDEDGEAQGSAGSAAQEGEPSGFAAGGEADETPLDLAELLAEVDGEAGAVVLQQTADVLGVKPGDVLEIQYAPPQTRLLGQAPSASAARRRTTALWRVRAIATQRGVTGQGDNSGILVSLASAGERFGIAGLAERIVLDYDPALYDARDPQRGAFAARGVTQAVRERLAGEDLEYRMPRPRAVLDGANAFIFFQSLISMYGLLSLSVVGMLIRTMILTNVQEQTRDMAVLRILGASRRFLFNTVAAEVAVIGVIGIGLGIVVGQWVNNKIIVRFIADRAGDMIADVPLVTLSGVLLAVAVGGLVLAISAWAPARKAANTKVTHAINPGVAEGLGLDDLAKMRERRTDLRISSSGLVVLTYPLLIFFAFPLAFDFGVLWMLAALFFGALLALIVGAALLFFVIILPFERLLLRLQALTAPRAGYFVSRTVLRGKGRNTLISLMIVMSATLPTFLSTTLALEVANTENDRKLSGGAPLRVTAPVTLDAPQGGGPPQPVEQRNFRSDVVEDLRADPGLARTVAMAAPYRSEIRDGVGLRDAGVRITAVDGPLRGLLYDEAIEVIAGGEQALTRILEERNAAIIGAGLADHLGAEVGDALIVDGEGLDHEEQLTVVGIARRIGGVGTFTAKKTAVWGGNSTVLIGMDSYRYLVNDPSLGPPDPNARMVRTLLAAPAPGVDEEAEAELTRDLRLRFGTEHGLAIDSTAESIVTVREEARTGQMFLLILTALTSALAVFGVFAVIYVSIYGRRGEIGMLKAMGAPGRHLLQVFVGEAMVMTLAATLTGVSAGIVLGYMLRVSEGFQNEVPTKFAIDTIVVPAMLGLMILASLVSATVATHGYRRRRAVDILRTL